MTKRSITIGAVVAGLVAAIMSFFLLNAGHNPATGTQGDPSVGTSRYPAPKDARSIPSNSHHTPVPAPVAVIDNPNAVPALSDVNAKCQWADPRGKNPPSLQDDNVGTQKFSDMPDTASTNTLKCAIARAKAAGYYAADNSVKCDESVIQLLDESNNKLWSFRPFCMTVGTTGSPLCKVTLIPTDYEGNFLRLSEPDLSRLQNFRAQAVIDEDPNAYASC